MKNFKLSILALLTVFVASSIFISCSNEDDNKEDDYKVELQTTNILKSSGVIYFDYNTNKFYEEGSIKNKSSNTTEYDIELSFISESEIPVFETNEELTTYLEENANNMNGVITFTIDNVVVYESTVLNGQKINSNKGSYLMKAYPCTFDGLSHCTQDRIDAMNWFDTAVCITGGFSCVAQNFISCGVDNC